ncbi:HPr family phosphocarrier protein, partial [Klebsiella variicola]|uniref:HPr family phosphocarrier protein n=1 Tax=Klebsiella variicola TaxID=244366 RepID=UPI0039C12494
MIHQEDTNTATNGQHTRPSAQFLKETKYFTSEITVTTNRKNATAKIQFKQQTHGQTQGTLVTHTPECEEEQKTVEQLVK